MLNRAVFLDRDGTLIKHVHHLSDPNQVEILPGVSDRLNAIRKAGWGVIVVTNQSIIGDGVATQEQMNQIHVRMTDILRVSGAGIHRILVCPHSANAGCFCRKPRPGLLYSAAVLHQLDLRDCLLIGDSNSDIAAAEAVRCNWFKVPTDEGLAAWNPSQLERL